MSPQDRPIIRQESAREASHTSISNMFEFISKVREKKKRQNMSNREARHCYFLSAVAFVCTPEET